MSRASLGRIPILLAALVAVATPAAALEPSGVAIKIDRTVDASGPAARRVLEVQGAVFMGDVLVSNPSGLAQIRFIDDTRIVVGPSTRLTIDRFVFNPDNTAKEVSINLLKGSLRFISGKSPSRVYSVRTPTIAVGVRGTVFDVNARGPDSSVVFLEGSGEICDVAGFCVQITDDCRMFVGPRGGGFYNPAGIERRQRLSVFFPFVVSQSRLDPAFRTNIRGCGSTAMFPGSAGEGNAGGAPGGGPPGKPQGGGGGSFGTRN